MGKTSRTRGMVRVSWGCIRVVKESLTEKKTFDQCYGLIISVPPTTPPNHQIHMLKP